MSATRGLTENTAGCVSANVSRFKAKVGGKPRAVCVQTWPGLHVFLLDEWRDIRRNNVENRWNATFGTRKPVFPDWKKRKTDRTPFLDGAQKHNGTDLRDR